MDENTDGNNSNEKIDSSPSTPSFAEITNPIHMIRNRTNSIYKLHTGNSNNVDNNNTHTTMDTITINPLHNNNVTTSINNKNNSYDNTPTDQQYDNNTHNNKQLEFLFKAGNMASRGVTIVTKEVIAGTKSAGKGIYII